MMTNRAVQGVLGGGTVDVEEEEVVVVVGPLRDPPYLAGGAGFMTDTGW